MNAASHGGIRKEFLKDLVEALSSNQRPLDELKEEGTPDGYFEN